MTTYTFPPLEELETSFNTAFSNSDRVCGSNYGSILVRNWVGKTLTEEVVKEQIDHQFHIYCGANPGEKMNFQQRILARVDLTKEKTWTFISQYMN